MDNQEESEFELSKRGNVRKFNHKIEEKDIDLNNIFPFKNKMNNATPNFMPQNKNDSSGGFKIN